MLARPARSGAASGGPTRWTGSHVNGIHKGVQKRGFDLETFNVDAPGMPDRYTHTPNCIKIAENIL